MAQRLTDPDKWKDPWFHQLSAPSKLIFLYFIDNCDIAGFLEFNAPMVAFCTGMKPSHIEGALKGLSRSILGPYDGWYWSRRFIRCQKNEPLNPSNGCHRGIIKILNAQSERFKDCIEFQKYIAPCKGLVSPLGIGIGKGTGKEREPERKQFVKPTREEARVYGQSIGMTQDQVDGWYDHFESNGWKVGGKAIMKDWKAALRTAKRRIHKEDKPGLDYERV